MSKQDTTRRNGLAALAAAVRAEQDRAERRRNLLTVVAVVVAIVAIVGGGFLFQSMRDTTGEADNAPTGTVSTATAGDAAVAAADNTASGSATRTPGEGGDLRGLPLPVLRASSRPLPATSSARMPRRQGYVVYRPIAFLNEYSARSLNAFAVVLNDLRTRVALKFHDLLYENQPSRGRPDARRRLADRQGRRGRRQGGGRPSEASRSPRSSSGWSTAPTTPPSGGDATPTVFVNGDRDRQPDRRPRGAGAGPDRQRLIDKNSWTCVGPRNLIRCGAASITGDRGLCSAQDTLAGCVRDRSDDLHRRAAQGRAPRPPRRLGVAAHRRRARGPAPRHGPDRPEPSWRSSTSSATSGTSSRCTSPSSA